MKNNMNKGFINRNRIFQMNTKSVLSNKAITDEDLFLISDDLLLMDQVAVDMVHSLKPNVVGVVSRRVDDERKYYTYENDELGEIKWILEFDLFSYAISFARFIYLRRHEDYRSNNNAKTLKK